MNERRKSLEAYFKLRERALDIKEVQRFLKRISVPLLESEEVEFVLSATAGGFVSWLEARARRLQFRPLFSTADGLSLSLQPPHVVTLERPDLLGPGITKLLLWGIYTFPQAKVPADPWPWTWMLTREDEAVFAIHCAAKPYPVPLGIEFVVATLDSERIEVSGRCDFVWLSDTFHGLLKDIGQRWPKAGQGVSSAREADDAEAAESGLPDWFPKRPDTIKKWKGTYAAMVEAREYYLGQYDNAEADDPTPRMSDFRDAATMPFGRRPCDKTIRRILRAGDQGLLG